MDTSKSQSENMEIRLSDAEGNSQPAANINYSIRPGRGFYVNLEIHNADLVTANTENMKDVKSAIGAFVSDAVKKAAALGLPVGE